MKGDITLLIPILFPMLAGAFLYISPLVKGKKEESIYAFYVVLMTLISSFILLRTGQQLVLFELMDGINIYFKVDHLGRIFVLLTGFMWLLSANYSEVYLKHQEHTKRYILFFLVALSMILGICCAGNLITLYLFFEWMTLSLVALVLHFQTVDAIGAAMKFLFYSISGTFMGFLGIAILRHYSSDPTMDFVAGGFLNSEYLNENSTLLYIAVFIMIVGFGCKTGMFPLHAWLPNAHPVAPAPASALLSGNVTKMGVLAVIRIVYYCVGVQYVKGTWVQYTWIGLALLTIMIGSILAYKEPVLKKRLAYSTISNLSYIMLGLSLCNPIALLGALLHSVFHSISKNTMFLIAGSIIYRTEKHRVEELIGIGKKMPVTMWCFVLASFVMVGVPPTSGFISKWYLAQGSIQSGIEIVWWLSPVILLLSACLTAGYLLPVAMKAFFPGKGGNYGTYTKHDVAKEMKEPMIIYVILGILLGIYPKPLLLMLEPIIQGLF